jgi:REP element-mobilizing transposase RayT
MSAPRQVLPGTTYLVTRRCSQRQFLLAPSRRTNQLFGYLLAVAAQRYGVAIHAACVMSNHFHLVLTDRTGRLPAFHQYLDSLVARSMNSLLGRWEHFWAPSSYNAVALEGPDDIVDKVAYVLANPVAAGLVRRSHQWPGLRLDPEQIDSPLLEFHRPSHFFRNKSAGGRAAMPDHAALVLVAPPGFASSCAFQRAVRSALHVRESIAARQIISASRNFVGATTVMHQRTSTRPRDSEPRRALRPRVASLDKVRRIQALGHLVAFLEAYRRAFAAWRAGDLEVVFPRGTYLMRVLHGVRCASPG